MSKTLLIPVGVLVMTLGAGGFADAGQRDSRGRDRNGRASQGQAAPRQDEGRTQPRGGAERSSPRRNQAPRATAPAPAPGQPRSYDRAGERRAAPAPAPQYRAVPAPRYDARRSPPVPRSNNRGYAVPRPDNRAYAYRDGYRDGYRYGSRNDRYRYYGPPRLIPYARAPRHYYGPGGSFSVYFGIGRGYLFGSPYYGRVYGYVPPHAYGVQIYYGDVRLEVRPRNAAVYVDGYYAGIVDDFDGVFQRLTLEVGAHQIELEAPGLEPQLFDVYVDPARTVTIHSDLYPY
jgi:hypothetical protein